MNKREQAQNELEKAEQARKNNNEGMARVCARRSANFALQGFLQAKNHNISTQNVIHLLNDPEIREIIPASLHVIFDHLLLKVNEDYQFNPEIDLIAETKFLINELQTLILKENEL